MDVVTTVEFVEAVDAGNDLLLVGGNLVTTPADGGEPTRKPIIARGWVSATTNHFGPECYWTEAECPEGLAPDDREIWLAQHIDRPGHGHRKDEAQPRAMTGDEKTAYCLRLLQEQYS